jgi:Fur family transcriptional regulator, ferric uptake regulator
MIDPAWREKIFSLLESKGLRLTQQRRVIIEAAFDTTEHYTADDLLLAAQKRDSSVSRATVYRTLKVLVEAGLLNDLDLGRDFKYYDPNFARHPRHGYVVCLDCQKIMEFEDPVAEKRIEQAVRKLRFRAAAKFFRIEARCEEWRIRGQCARAKKRPGPAVSF